MLLELIEPKESSFFGLEGMGLMTLIWRGDEDERGFYCFYDFYCY